MVVPTTGDRGPLLVHSIGSAQRQTLTDIEIFVVGDGVDDPTREVIEDLAANDHRVRFFDFAKHERRGEPYRHELLTSEARGAFVAYLCDRDLWLPRHLEVSQALLESADGAHTLRFGITPEGEYRVPYRHDLADPVVRQRRSELAALVPLSTGSHTLDAYRRLPHGWRTTPDGLFTDRYMWDQILGESWFTMATSFEPTVLWFKRGDHPGWSVEQRLEELDVWSARMCEPDFEIQLARGIIAAMGRDQIDLRNRLTAASPAARVRSAVPVPMLDAARRAAQVLPPSVRNRLRQATTR